MFVRRRARARQRVYRLAFVTGVTVNIIRSAENKEENRLPEGRIDFVTFVLFSVRITTITVTLPLRLTLQRQN